MCLAVLKKHNNMKFYLHKNVESILIIVKVHGPDVLCLFLTFKFKHIHQPIFNSFKYLNIKYSISLNKNIRHITQKTL